LRISKKIVTLQAKLEAISIALTELQMQKRKEKPIKPIGFNAPQYKEDNQE